MPLPLLLLLHHLGPGRGEVVDKGALSVIARVVLGYRPQLRVGAEAEVDL